MSQDPQSRLYDRLHRSPAPAVKQRDIWDKVQAVSSLSSCDASCPSSTIWTPLSAFCKPAWGTTNQKQRPISSRPRSHKYHDAAASISPPLPAAVASALGGIVDLQAYQRNHKSEEILSAQRQFAEAVTLAPYSAETRNLAASHGCRTCLLQR
jgi:hypothetical protein